MVSKTKHAPEKDAGFRAAELDIERERMQNEHAHRTRIANGIILILTILSGSIPAYIIQSAIVAFAGKVTTVSVSIIVTASVAISIGSAVVLITTLLKSRGQKRELIRVRKRLAEQEEEIARLRVELGKKS